MKMERQWAMPSMATFTIKPIAELLKRYSAGKNWIDPFAGNNSPAEITNDHNPETKATYHLEAMDFAKGLKGKYDGLLFDPPYSYRQVSEHYKVIGKKATQLDTKSLFPLPDAPVKAKCNSAALEEYTGRSAPRSNFATSRSSPAW